ncbi:transporter substrate-binding domain-containing protein [Collinsella tanakaei]|uniref:transporter substrate-binding domain-containing protein n=1 Tax=Collinsella tanakaei TaxID=626935 RepID=UPI0025A4B06D|nr:transporter substrate-binding domain-containing protein [Collinsella tanakaei]MDM8246691.1 transporter substrate-binding domain-containing protein [Collinsella tanakaei]
MLNQKISRRDFLAAVAAVSALGLAGCGGTSADVGSASASADGDLLAQISDRGEMVFATEGTWSPWTFHNEAGELTGFDIEVARAIADKLGVGATFAEGEWDGLLAGLDSGRYDTMANGVSVTPEREGKYDFTEPYAYNRIVVITTADSDIASMEDLEGKTTANTLGSSYATLAESFGATNTGVDDFNQTIQLLESGRIDATLNDEVVFYDYMNQHPDAALKIAAENDEPTHVAFPLRREAATESLLAAMNEAIAELREDGTLAELSQEFFGIDITEA